MDELREALLDAAFHQLQHDTGPQDVSYRWQREQLGKAFAKILKSRLAGSVESPQRADRDGAIEEVGAMFDARAEKADNIRDCHLWKIAAKYTRSLKSQRADGIKDDAQEGKG